MALTIGSLGLWRICPFKTTGVFQIFCVVRHHHRIKDSKMAQDAYEIINAGADSPWFVTCDHASNTVPPWINGGDLGLPAADMQRHIAFDVGAAGVTRHLSKLLNAPAILSNFSRLVIDPNRGEDDPTLIMEVYDGTIIPANRGFSPADRQRRLDALYRPYHDAIAHQLVGKSPVYLAIHSFTQKLNGKSPRPWHVTVLAAEDKRFSDPLLAALEAQPDICTAENEPYIGKLRGDSVDRHALHTGRPNALIEIRNDLIETEAGQKEWAERLVPLLQAALAEMA